MPRQTEQQLSAPEMDSAPDPKRPYYRVDPNMDRYISNTIPAFERWWNFGLSLFVLAWGSYGLLVDELIVPINKRADPLYLKGTAAVVMFCAMVAAVLNLLAVIMDHFDTRNNEITYRRVAFGTQVLGWVLFGSAILVHIWAK